MSFWPIALGVVFCTVGGQHATAHGQSEGSAPARTTASGVYSAAQAAKGEETYLGICASCHPAGTYKTPAFKGAWNGRPLSELFDLISETMPKNAPGSLELGEYAQVLAYLLKVNDMPAGKNDLPADSTELKQIRIEIGKSAFQN